jgi:hypothetical protein
MTKPRKTAAQKREAQEKEQERFYSQLKDTWTLEAAWQLTRGRDTNYRSNLGYFLQPGYPMPSGASADEREMYRALRARIESPPAEAEPDPPPVSFRKRRSRAAGPGGFGWADMPAAPAPWRPARGDDE